MTEQPAEYCDLVMKGGITSGLVYPNAVLALAKRYRFKNIGGTSAGAIAAVATAAAALGERRKPKLDPVMAADAGMAGLARVAAQLTHQGFIYSLFQPSRGARSAYRMMVRLTAGRGLLGKIAVVTLGIAATAGLELAIALIAFLGLGWWIGGLAGMASALLPAFFCSLTAAAICGAMRLARAIRRNQMGLCTGLGQTRRFGKRQPGLTDWLHSIIQSLGGLPLDRPLLFSDLWDAERYPDEPESRHAISLQMIATGVSHSEPRSLPFDNGQFWFLREDFDRLFPETVVEWMVKADPSPRIVDGRTYYRLPADGALPVVVAARMSLSFPILISAIPLYEADYSAAKRAGAALGAAPAEALQPAQAESLTVGGAATPVDGADVPFRICWFSDGGISSNFPLHLFDGPLPRWPTFAINLVYSKTSDGGADQVYLPNENNRSWQRRYVDFANRFALSEVASFLFAIIGTMQNWRDLLQARAPGHRDRIVHVPLTSKEGGLNLDMDQAILDSIAAKGTLAGVELATKFDFNNHYWVRWRNVAATTEKFAVEFAIGAGPPITVSYAGAHAAASAGTKTPPSYRFTSKKVREEAQARFAVMTEQGLKWGTVTPSLHPGAPRPEPVLRIVPIY
ncbi:MAG: patatin-like phospholipase family protein [Sphingomonas sp.]